MMLCLNADALAQTSPVDTPQTAPAAVPSQGAVTRVEIKAPILTTINPAFYIVTDSPGAESGANAMISLGVAEEIRKAMKPLFSAAPWIVAEPSWSASTLENQCYSDAKALGGVLVTYYAGAASHFFLLYQEETQTFYVTAQVIACNRSPGENEALPTVVGIIGLQLASAVRRRTNGQVTIEVYPNGLTVEFRGDQYLWWQVAEFSYDSFMIRNRTRL